MLQIVGAGGEIPPAKASQTAACDLILAHHEVQLCRPAEEFGQEAEILAVGIRREEGGAVAEGVQVASLNGRFWGIFGKLPIRI